MSREHEIKNSIQPIIDPLFEFDPFELIEDEYTTNTYIPIKQRTTETNNPDMSFVVPGGKPGRFIDLQKTFLSITIQLPTGIKPNQSVSVVNNFPLFLFDTARLLINREVIEEYTYDYGTINSIINYIKYDKKFSESDAALYDMCWAPDTHGFFTTNDGTNVYAPNTAITYESAMTLSGGMDNSCNGIPFVPFANAGGLAQEAGINHKYSKGFERRQRLITNAFKAQNNNATNLNPNGNKVTFQIPLSHMFLSCASQKKALLGGEIELQLKRNTGINYKAFCIDVSNVDTDLITFPQQPIGAFTNTLRNIQSPSSVYDPTTDNALDVKITDITLYVHQIDPKPTMKGAIFNKYYNSKNPIFYSYICAEPHRNLFYGQTVSQEMTCHITDIKYVIIAHQYSQSTPLYNLTPNNKTLLYGDIGSNSRSTLGTSNYAVFDPLDVSTIGIEIDDINYPIDEMSNNTWKFRDFTDRLRNISEFRSTMFEALNGIESTPFITAENWTNLYPFYVIDVRGNPNTIAEKRTRSHKCVVKIQYTSPTPSTVSIYTIFVGNTCYEMTDSTLTKL